MAEGTYNVAPIGIEITSKLDGMVKGLLKLENELKKTDKETQKATYALQKMAGTMGAGFKSFFTMAGFGSFQQSMRTISKLFTDSSRAANDLVENYNLFTVASGVNTAQNVAFQEKLNKAFRTNISETYRVQGRFENLAGSLGIANKESQILSENLTKLTYDLSSLFNISQTLASSKVMSGIVGQTKPLRELGIDVTMQTLQTDLDRLGINAQVAQLTQAEKVLLRYIAVMRQSTNAQGDMARTIETNANQLRILKSQVQEATMWFGTIFYGAIGKVLPYLNAMVFTLRDIFKWLSGIFGFDIEDYNFMKTPQEDTELLDDLLNETDKSAKTLKKSLMGFDELNMLSSSTGNDTPLGDGSYYDQLLKYIVGYDNGMADIDMRANSIADSFKKWLGFGIDIDGEITGIDGGLAAIAKLTFDNIKSFVTNLIKFVNDVAKWFKDNPTWAKSIVDFLSDPFVQAAGILILGIFDPLWGIKLAGMWFIANYDKISKWWSALTPEQKVITSLVALAAAIGLVAISLTSGLAAPAILGAFAGLIALTGVAFALNDFNKEVDKRREEADPYKYENAYPSYERWQRTTHTPEFADGGFPQTGQMFIARESGAEMVGSIGGRTAVANNSQIVEAVSQGVAIAVSGVIGNGGNTTINMYLDDILTGQAMINTINRTTKTTGNTVLVG